MAKMFVTMLKSGAVPFKNQTLRGSSVDPPECGASRSANENKLTGKEGEHSCSPPTDAERTATAENLDRIYIGEEHSEQLARISYRFRSGGCEDNSEEEDRDRKSHSRGSSRSRRHDEDDENENVVETDDKHYGRRYRSHSSFTEIDYERESNEEDRDHECSKPRHHSLHSQNEDVGHVDEVKKVKDHKQSRKKHRWYRSRSSFTEIDYEREINEEDRDHECSKPRHPSRHSQKEDVGHVDEVKKVKDHKQSRKKHRCQLSSRKRLRSSKRRSEEENESDRDGRDHKHSRKKHRSQHSSGHGRDNHRHMSRHSSREKKSRNTSSIIALQMMLRIVLAWIKVKKKYMMKETSWKRVRSSLRYQKDLEELQVVMSAEKLPSMH